VKGLITAAVDVWKTLRAADTTRRDTLRHQVEFERWKAFGRWRRDEALSPAAGGALGDAGARPGGAAHRPRARPRARDAHGADPAPRRRRGRPLPGHRLARQDRPRLGRRRTAPSCEPSDCRPGPGTSARPTPPRSAPTAPSSLPAGGPARAGPTRASTCSTGRAAGCCAGPAGCRHGPPPRLLARRRAARRHAPLRSACGWSTPQRAGSRPRTGTIGDQSYGAAFDRAGRLATTSFDGKVRLYGPDLRLLKVRARAGRRAAVRGRLLARRRPARGRLRGHGRGRRARRGRRWGGCSRPTRAGWTTAPLRGRVVGGRGGAARRRAWQSAASPRPPLGPGAGGALHRPAARPGTR
jgi:hypothetical protein